MEVSEPNVDSDIPQDIIDNNPVTGEGKGTVINTGVTEKIRMLNITDKEIEATLQRLIHIPENLEEIIPRADQVWNCDEIGLDQNGKWHRIICTYKWYNIDRIWKTKEGEHEPL